MLSLTGDDTHNKPADYKENIDARRAKVEVLGDIAASNFWDQFESVDKHNQRPPR